MPDIWNNIGLMPLVGILATILNSRNDTMVVSSGWIKCHTGPSIVCLYLATKSRRTNSKSKSLYCQTSFKLKSKTPTFEDITCVHSSSSAAEFVMLFCCIYGRIWVWKVFGMLKGFKNSSFKRLRKIKLNRDSQNYFFSIIDLRLCFIFSKPKCASVKFLNRSASVSSAGHWCRK